MTPTDDTLIVSFLRGRFGHTQRSYRTSIDQFRQWFATRNPGVSILTAERDDIQTWIQNLSRRHLDPGTISVRRSAVRQLFDYLVDEELITVSPATRITVPRSSEPTPKALTNDEVRRLLAAAADLSPRHYALVAALAFIGCRVSEICTARIQDLHTGPDGSLWLDLRAKGNKRQRRPVVPALQAALEPVTADRRQGPLLASRRGPGLSPSAAREYVKEVGARAGIDGVHPHRFRHAAVTRLVEDTGDLLMAKAVAGHASYDTTARYFAGVDLSEIQRRGAETLAAAYTNPRVETPDE